VSRLQNTSCQVPADAPAICAEFIRHVQSLINLNNNKDENILNMDQVPRYFETEHASIITTRGSHNILLKKIGSSHKRLTVTFIVSAAVHMLKSYVLFNKLKKKPDCTSVFLVDVNKTGMWTEEIFLQHAMDMLLCRRQTSFYKEPELYIIYSYGVHITAFNAKRLANHNIFIVIVPPCLTNIVQPLYIAINRSFQAFYVTCFDKNIDKAIIDVRMQTKAGNTKCPDYLTVTSWCQKWIESFPSASICKASAACGLVSKTVVVLTPRRALNTKEVEAVSN
jgi:hypothetical protein